MKKWTQFLLLGAIGLGSMGVAFAAYQSINFNDWMIRLSSAATLAESSKKTAIQDSKKSSQSFLVFGGGGAPSYNEIALEKNILYFQRSLQQLGFNPASVPIYFANGNTGEKTIRYFDDQRNQQFKTPEIPNLKGASSITNLQNWIAQTVKQSTIKQQPPGRAAPLFFYFTGHGEMDEENNDNNYLLLWKEQALTVQDFAQMLDRLPEKMPFVTMMSQCYSGSFANLIYKGGNPNQGVALQTRCGFFATVKTQPSVGCTPEVNEADYRDYSSSFFAGLSGRDRTGQSVASADYNQDGHVSYAEAHAFAKVDERTTDLPISTSEAWLQRQVSDRTMREELLGQSIAPLEKVARPEQRYVINALSQKFGFDVQRSFSENVKSLKAGQAESEEDQAYLMRLAMELTNVAMEQRVKSSNNPQSTNLLNRLINCESGSWGKL